MASTVPLASRGGIVTRHGGFRAAAEGIIGTVSTTRLLVNHAPSTSGRITPLRRCGGRSQLSRPGQRCLFSTVSPVSGPRTPLRPISRSVAGVGWTRPSQSRTSLGRWWQVQVRSSATKSNRDEQRVDKGEHATSTPSTSKPSSTPSPPPSPTKGKLSNLIPRLTQPVRHENIYTIPNILTFTRLVAAPAVGYFILHNEPLLAVSLFFYAGITDMVDGYLARKYNSQTVVGTVIDPMADKALMTIAVVTLTMNGTLPIWLATIILGRDIALAISAIYFRWISLPPPKTMARYWDFSLPSAEVHPTEISKINTFLQLLLVGNAMLLPVLPDTLVNAWNLPGIFEGWTYLVATTTVWSGLSYIGNKDAVKILTTEQIDAKVQERDAEKKETQSKK